ncbi:restriction endonuclease subunit S [Vibrio parahaemolyticus]|uniref:restriction endonuclease subunit S n=1 Tax=Vibrio parahaemolyticus TaxID=670 RepID=UPI0003F67846|nr:restriction endonuclease subunit S [Vibrio parahaemolyticus]EHV9705078.1 restriction endonuclease subunit S [Vibrio parahaemolyticus]EIZ1547619.1 restriction endonuclease subunit S [Vibrio parahaemolyticus]
MSWPLVKLTEVAEVNPRCSKDIDEDQIVSFVAMASASEEGVLLGEEPKILKDTKKGFTYFERGDVLLAKITPCFENGKSLRPYQIKHQVGFGSTEFHVVRADLEKLDPTYLFYLLWSDAFRFLGTNAMAGAAGQKRVGTPFLKQLEIPLPPLEEQKRIAAILDKADVIRQKRKQAIDLADEFLRSVFLDMFGDPVTNPKGWEIKAIGELATKVTDGEHQTPKREEKGYKLLSARNVQHGFLDVENEKVDYVGEAEFQRITKRLSISKSDVLLSCSGTIGRVSMNTLNEPFCLVRSVAVIRLADNGVIPEFLVGYLGTSALQAIMKKEANSSGQPNLFQNQIKQLKVLVPPLELQAKYKRFLDHYKEKKASLISGNEQQALLFKSLSQKAFSGQL